MKNHIIIVIWLGISSILSSCAVCPEKQELEVCKSDLGTVKQQKDTMEAKLETCEQAVSKGESVLESKLETCEQAISKGEAAIISCEQGKNTVKDELETSAQRREELQANLQKCEQENRHVSCITACQSEFQSAFLDCQDYVKDVASPIVRDKSMNECLKNEGFPDLKNSCPKRCGK